MELFYHFFDIPSHIPPKLLTLVFASMTYSKAFFLWWNFALKNYFFCLMQWNLDRLEGPEGAIGPEKSPYLNSLISGLKLLHFRSKVSVQRLSFNPSSFS